MNAAVPLTRPEPEPLVVLDLEQQVIGGLLANPKSWPRVQTFLRAEHFGDTRHQAIFQAVADMHEAQLPPTPATLASLMQSTEELQRIGGVEYLRRIVASVIAVANTEDYARVVLDLAVRRRAVTLLEDACARLRGGLVADFASRQLAETASALDELAAVGTVPSAVAIGEAASTAVATARSVVEGGARPMIVPTGFTDLDAVVRFKPGRVYILGARPSAGKTSLAQWIAVGAARQGHGVAFFTLEMDAESLANRWLSGMTGIDAQRVDMAQVQPFEIDRLDEARETIAALPITLETSASPGVDDIVAGVRKLVRERVPVSLVVIDYLGLLRWPAGAKSLYEATTRNSAALKAAAKSLNLPLLVLSQLNRATESRDDKRPSLADLRDSGAIEQDADAVMFLHREHYYVMRAKPAKKQGESESDFAGRVDVWETQEAECRGKAEVSVAKNRAGRLGYVALHFDDATTRFTGMARGE